MSGYLINKMKFNKEIVKKLSLNKIYKDFNFEKVKGTQTIYDFDSEFTLKLVDRQATHKSYYDSLSCTDNFKTIDTPMLFIHSQNDPICP